MHFFFFNDTATTEIYTLSLHDALPIWVRQDPRTQHHPAGPPRHVRRSRPTDLPGRVAQGDRKSTRLNSSHSQISYAVFCLKKKKERFVPHVVQRDQRRYLGVMDEHNRR